MDHITQLYQNRAKVLQEEVNRLEALLEAVKDIEVGDTEDVEGTPSREISTPAAGGSKKKKDEDTAGLTDQQIAQLQYDRNLEAVGSIIPNTIKGGVDLAKLAYNNPKGTSAVVAGTIAGLVGLDYLTNKIAKAGARAGTNLPGTSKVLQAGWEMLPPARIAREKAEKAIEAERVAKALAYANIEKLQHQALDVYGKGLPAYGTGARAARLPYDPAEAALFPNRPAGVGAPKPSTMPGAFQMVSNVIPPGEAMKPSVQQRILTGNYSYPAMLADPDVLKAGLEGVKDVAMTGKEVAGKIVKAASTPLPGSSSAIASGLARGGAGVVGDIVGEYIVKPAAEKAGVFKAVEAGTRSALSASPDWVAKVADPALGAAQVILDPLSSAVSAMQKPMEQGAEKEAEELVKRAGSPSKIRFTGKSKI